ncbi:MAG: DnaJ domain-containing protein [Nitrospinae bacterium]|nr:DnaJ domain-containing protein [Nitrospinota bacterium]
MAQIDYYRLLKVKPGATKEEIRKAYKKFAFHFHPDRSKYDEELFLLVHEAYEALMKIADEPVVIPPPPPPKKEIKHDLSFVKGRLKRSQIWAPDFHLFRRPKITVESNQCTVCDGYGVIANKHNIAIHCPNCNGTGHKTRIVI